jgi:hypothetical protein
MFAAPCDFEFLPNACHSWRNIMRRSTPHAAFVRSITFIAAGIVSLITLGAAPSAFAICPIDGCVGIPPTAHNQTVDTFENQSVLVTLTASGTGPISYFIDSNPTFGSLSALSGAHVTYTPNHGFVGTDSFTFEAANLVDISNFATVTIRVDAVPEPQVWALLVVGLIGLGIATRRAQKVAL